MMEADSIQADEAKKLAGRLWSRDFLLLWQGQFVSAAGDVVYGIALGFWVLESTGSTAMMGTLMAASMWPRVVISPFAGVIVDRSDRRKLLIFTDLVRGVAVGIIALAAFCGEIRIWMLFSVGIVIGICGAFFNPAVSSVIPDIVSKTKLVKANSAFGMIYNISGIVGNSAGGFLYAFLGAPLMFLFNGCSYIFSAITELFIKIPSVERAPAKRNFFEEMKSGYRFVWDFRALRYLMLLASALNFFAGLAFVLLLPLFQRTEGLGPGPYGVVMAFFTGGLFAGMLLTSLVHFKPAQRFRIFMPTAFVFSIFMAAVPIYLFAPVMALLMFVCGICMALVNVFIQATMQLVIPQDIRGRVFSLLAMLASSLMPLAFITGGLLAEFIAIRLLYVVSCILMGVLFVPMMFMPSFKKFINFDPDKHTLQDIL